MYYRGSAAAVIVYDITKLVSLFFYCVYRFGPNNNIDHRKTFIIPQWGSLRKEDRNTGVTSSWDCCAFVIQDSFQTLKKWVKELKEHGPEDIVVAIAGNKNDLGDIRWVCFEGLLYDSFWGETANKF